jgi:hypothetical protein
LVIASATGASSRTAPGAVVLMLMTTINSAVEAPPQNLRTRTQKGSTAVPIHRLANCDGNGYQQLSGISSAQPAEQNREFPCEIRTQR